MILENDFEVFRSAVSSGNIAFSRFLLKIAIADPAQKIASLKILLQAVADPEERHQIIIHELKEASNNATLLDLLLKEFVLEYIDADERWQKAMDYTDYNSTFSHMFRGALQSVNTDVLNILTNLTPDPEKGKGIATINDIPRYLFFTAVENGNYQFLDFLFRCASEETKLLALTYGDDKSDTLFERSLLCGAHTKVLKLILKEANDYPESRAKLISAASSFFCNNFVNRDGGDIRNATAVFRRLLDVILQNKEIITHSSGRLFSGVINVINSTFATKTTRNFINIGTLELILKALTDSTERAALIINREGLTKSCHNVRTTDLLLKAITPENEISILLPAINFIQSTHLSIDISNRFLLQDFKLSPANRNAIKRLLEASPLHTHGERDIFMLGKPILPSDNPSLQIIKRVYQEACEILLGGLEESETQQLIIEEMARRVGNYIFLNGGIEEIAQARDNFITLKLSSEKAGQPPTGISNMIPDVWKTILEFRIPYSFEEVDSADYPGNEVFVELVNTIARKFLEDHRLTPCAIADYEPREVIMDDPPASVLAASAEASARLAATGSLELGK